MPHGLTIDHEGNTWLTDVAMHQVGFQCFECALVKTLPMLIIAHLLAKAFQLNDLKMTSIPAK